VKRKRANILGVGIDVIDFKSALTRIEELIESRGNHFVCVNSVQDIMISQKNERFRKIVNNSDLATPDGWPVVWAIKLNGYKQKQRVTGPDLMIAMCERSVKKGYSHFFYGGAAEVPDLLEAKLKEKFPELKVAGKYSPPFRPLTPEEDTKIIEIINKSDADILWIGLSTPKQHFWMEEHFRKIQVPVMFTVGAGFDFHSGRVPRAPVWMQKSGLEWFHRIMQEPKRLGKRYLEYLPLFAFKLTGQLLGIKTYKID